MTILWQAIYQGKLCRIRRTAEGLLVSESWRNGSWVEGPNFAEVDFKGRTVQEDEAQAWIRSRFRNPKKRKG